MNKASERVGEAEIESKKALLRTFVIGNAGGAIATLSLIGTVIGSSTDSRFDKGSLYVLILFLVGLAFGALNHFGKLRWAEAAYWMLNFEKDDPRSIPPTKRAIRWIKFQTWTFWLSGIMMAIGIIIGLFQLWSFSK